MNLKNIIKVFTISLIININLYSGSINNFIYQYELGYQEKAIKNLYLQNKVINIYKKFCDDGDMEACSTLGFMYYKNSPITHRTNISREEVVKIAKKLFTKACDNGNNKGCYGLTQYLLYSPPTYNKVKRKILLEKTCKNGYMPACNSVGISCGIGQGTKKAKEAKKYYKKSCNNNNMRGCFLLGGFYDSLYFQTKNKTDKKIALKSYSKACQNINTPIEDACRKYVSLSEYGNY